MTVASLVSPGFLAWRPSWGCGRGGRTFQEAPWERHVQRPRGGAALGFEGQCRAGAGVGASCGLTGGRARRVLGQSQGWWAALGGCRWGTGGSGGLWWHRWSQARLVTGAGACSVASVGAGGGGRCGRQAVRGHLGGTGGGRWRGSLPRAELRGPRSELGGPRCSVVRAAGAMLPALVSCVMVGGAGRRASWRPVL